MNHQNIIDTLRTLDSPATAGAVSRVVGKSERFVHSVLRLLHQQGYLDRHPVKSGKAGRPAYYYTLRSNDQS